MVKFKERLNAPLKDKIDEKIDISYVVEEVLKANINENERFDIEIGKEIHSMKTKSLRYQLFARDLTKNKQIKCACCGIKAEYFEANRNLTKNKQHNNIYHLNLYGEIGNKKVLFTKDHIVPKKLGGTNDLDNIQTMCTDCNHIKSAENMTIEELREIINNNKHLTSVEISSKLDKERKIENDRDN